MNAMIIQQHVDEIKDMINASRSYVADGKAVDISSVEEKMSQLFDAVNQDPQLAIKVDVVHIANSLAELMEDLDGLESDLTDQNSAIQSDINSVSAGSAAAAYGSTGTN